MNKTTENNNNNNNTIINWSKLETKWKSKWKQEHLFEADYDNTNSKKYFITVAFPYPNSPQHIGHGRTYALADVHARYMRMKGYNVLFPMGFHYTGTPILAMSKRVIAQDQDLIKTFKNLYNVPEDIIESFIEPENIAKFFHNEIKLGMQDMGYSIDWRREFTTIDILYSKFITWQFKVLQKKGLIVQGSHPVGWCPHDKNPVSQHDTLGDVEPEFSEYILIKFRLSNNNNNEDIVLPTATLRPETIFGVTNLWINPDIEYFVIDVDNSEQWIVTEEASIKLQYLNHDIKFNKIIKGNELAGKFARDIVRNIEIPILPAKFVKSDTGTGVVMSVPGHAPYDFQALNDLKKDTSSSFKDIDLSQINPIKIIKVQSNNDNTANNSMLYVEDIISNLKIDNQLDSKLEKATTEVYQLEYYQGEMLPNTGKYSGMSVQLAKENIKNYLITTNNIAEIFYELNNKPIKCRCGTECVVKLLQDQWFINYKDKEWKSKVHDYIDKLSILPDDLRQEFHNVVDWLKERACARKSGLGTKLPWDHEWIIESLSDSVIYMAYYIISKFVNEEKYLMRESLSNIDETFFDYILLEIGDANEVARNCNLSVSLLKEIRNEFIYFYPVDSRHSGRDLVPNHLTFFIFNHIAIFEKKFWPHQIVVNGSVLMEGKKMSKSLGNIIPLRTAIQEYGADTIRLAILISAELLQDADFSFDTAKSIRTKLLEFYTLSQQYQQIFFNSNLNDNNDNNNKKLSNLVELSIDEYLYHHIFKNEYPLESEDKWLISKLQRLINTITKSLETLRVREALHNILYVFDQDIHWYKKRIIAKNRDSNSIVNNILVLCLSIRIKLLSPFAPFISEEIWNNLGNIGSIVSSKWPDSIFGDVIDSLSEESEEFIKKLSSDISNIIKVTKKLPNKIYIYCSSSSKRRIYQKILKIITINNERNFGNIMKKLIEDPETSYAKKDPSFVKKIVEDILSESVESRTNRLNLNSFDEISIIKDSQTLIANEIQVKNVQIIIYSEEEKEKYDPKLKSKFSRPFKPAIYLE